MKKSFLLYCDTFEVIKRLSNEQKGMLLERIYKYNLGNDTETEDAGVELVFPFFKIQFDRDNEKFEHKCEKNKASGFMGGRPKKTETEKNQTVISKTENNRTVILETERLKGKAKKADSDSDSDSDSDIIKKDNTIVLSKKTQKIIAPNSFEEAEKFFENIKTKIEAHETLEVELVKFYNYWTAPMKNGKPLWRSEKTFAFKLRLNNWMNKKFQKKPESIWSINNNKPERGTIG